MEDVSGDAANSFPSWNRNVLGGGTDKSGEIGVDAFTNALIIFTISKVGRGKLAVDATKKERTNTHSWNAGG